MFLFLRADPEVARKTTVFLFAINMSKFNVDVFQITHVTVHTAG